MPPRGDQTADGRIVVPVPTGANGIPSGMLSMLFSDEDLLYERPEATHVPARAPSARVAAPALGVGGDDVEGNEDWVGRTMWEATGVAFGAELGNLLGGRAATVICATAAFFWARRRWPGQ
jgi:hypothetical protein